MPGRTTLTADPETAPGSCWDSDGTVRLMRERRLGGLVGIHSAGSALDCGQGRRRHRRRAAWTR